MSILAEIVCQAAMWAYLLYENGRLVDRLLVCRPDVFLFVNYRYTRSNIDAVAYFC